MKKKALRKDFYMEVKKRPHYVICCTNDDEAQKNK